MGIGDRPQLFVVVGGREGQHGADLGDQLVLQLFGDAKEAGLADVDQ